MARGSEIIIATYECGLVTHSLGFAMAAVRSEEFLLVLTHEPRSSLGPFDVQRVGRAQRSA